jgi:hypothetical protein
VPVAREAPQPLVKPWGRVSGCRVRSFDTLCEKGGADRRVGVRGAIAPTALRAGRHARCPHDRAGRGLVLPLECGDHPGRVPLVDIARLAILKGETPRTDKEPQMENKESLIEAERRAELEAQVREIMA